MASQDTTQASTTDAGLVSRETAGIHLDNLGKKYETDIGSERVFKDLNIEIEPGSFVTLVGRSGSGKSTILNIITNVIEPTEGRIWFDNEQGEEIDAKLGHVFQSPRLLPWRTSLQNIGYVNKKNPDYTEEVGKRQLDMVGLEDHYDKYPSQLSGGQRQRVGIARALSIDPDILIMDEPFSNLDEITAKELRAELLDLWHQLGKTILFVTHDLNEAIELSERILMLGEGKIYADREVPLGYPRELDSEEFLVFREDTINTFYSVQGEVEPSG